MERNYNPFTIEDYTNGFTIKGYNDGPKPCLEKNMTGKFTRREMPMLVNVKNAVNSLLRHII